MKLSVLITFLLLISMTLFSSHTPEADTAFPNIIYILADDLGYGDVSALNPQAAWKTEQIDRIAAEGMVFTDAHSGSAVCTPTRYGVLTGRYAWRTRLKEGVLWSWDPPLIESAETTAGSLLQAKGYHTACIGKWHLGLGWQFQDAENEVVDFSLPVSGGPVNLGFDHFFGITASLDIPPDVYIEDDRATMVPDRYTHNNSKMGWWRKGLTSEDFDHQLVLPLLTEKAVAYIDKEAQSGNAEPFFLYFPLPAPHTPILPMDEFMGESKTNAYGDFVLQVDHVVGQILEALERNGIKDETLLIFTSDNGCSPEADFDGLSAYGHNPSYHFRGAKADIFEGGHRIPFLVSWPGRVKPGGKSSQTICLTDLLATLAAITGYDLQASEGVDSYNLLPAMLGSSEENIREATVHHSVNGSFAIRKGPWKLILCPDSGGWSTPLPGSREAGKLPAYQLYNLEEDPGEQDNLYPSRPEIALELETLLTEYKDGGRSTPLNR